MESEQAHALRALVRAHLERAPLDEQRRLELEDELTQMLCDALADAGIDATDPAARRRWLVEQVAGLDRLTASLARRPPASTAAPLRRAFGGLDLDLLTAARRLTSRPLATGVAVATLALAIGLGAAAFGLVDSLLFKPLAVKSPETLMHVYSSSGDGGLFGNAPLSFPDLAFLEERTGAFAGVLGHALVQLVLDAEAEPAVLYGEVATGNTFSLLGVEPQLGRLLTEADDRRESPARVAVLSDRCWRRRFGADAGIIGREVRLNGVPVTVVGITPPGFIGLFRAVTPEVWAVADANVTAGHIGQPPFEHAPAYVTDEFGDGFHVNLSLLYYRN